MSKGESILGIDLGTSSVKVILKSRDGTAIKGKEAYEEQTPSGWQEAVKRAVSGLDLSHLKAIGLSSQVGTYIVNGRDIIGWNSKKGEQELAEVKTKYDRETFIREISMPHPDMISYPLPRLSYIQKHYSEVRTVCQPKDFLCEMLTGNCVTDPYSWRGLANLSTGRFSQKLLEGIGFPAEKLPRLTGICDIAGYTRGFSSEEPVIPVEKSAFPIEKTVFPTGIPVFTGMNDFFSSLLGMGIYKTGELFDITGTSEHLGVSEPSLNPDTGLVSGPYLRGNVHYGVTASSGASFDYGMRIFGLDNIDVEQCLKNRPPIFLPYLNGERAPIWDADAQGMFFGIHGTCGKSEMAYAVLEGVAFSLYHIYECMGKPKADVMRVSGGASANRTLNEMKAELFGVPVVVPEETDTSALGAWMAAAVGLGWFTGFEEAAEQNCKIKETITPCGRWQKILKQRFAVYKELYPATRKLMTCLRISAIDFNTTGGLKT